MYKIPNNRGAHTVSPVGAPESERELRELGGSLEINSSGTGTVVVARLPVACTSLIVA